MSQVEGGSWVGHPPCDGKALLLFPWEGRWSPGHADLPNPPQEIEPPEEDATSLLEAPPPPPEIAPNPGGPTLPPCLGGLMEVHSSEAMLLEEPSLHVALLPPLPFLMASAECC